MVKVGYCCLLGCRTFFCSMHELLLRGGSKGGLGEVPCHRKNKNKNPFFFFIVNISTMRVPFGKL